MIVPLQVVEFHRTNGPSLERLLEVLESYKSSKGPIIISLDGVYSGATSSFKHNVRIDLRIVGLEYSDDNSDQVILTVNVVNWPDFPGRYKFTYNAKTRQGKILLIPD